MVLNWQISSLLQNKKIICIMVTLAMVLSLAIQTVPAFALTEPPVTDAEVATVVDIKTGTILFEKNKDKRKNPGSATKLMTALVVADKDKLTDTAKSQIRSMLVEGNDTSAQTLAKDTYGTSKNFVKQMNKKAKELGCKNTNFVSETGATKSKKHYSTSLDMATIVSEFMSKKDLRKLFQTEKLAKEKFKWVTVVSADGKKTPVSSVVLGEKGDSEFVAVSIGGATAKGNIDDGVQLVKYGFTNYRTYMAMSKGKSAGRLKVKGGQKSYVKVYAKEDLYVTLPSEGEDELVKTQLVLKENIKAPVKSGAVVGKIQALEAGMVTSEVDVVVKEAVNVGGPWSKIGISDYMMIAIGATVIILLIIFIIIRAKIRKKKKKIAEMRRRKREAEALKIAQERAEKRRRNWPY